MRGIASNSPTLKTIKQLAEIIPDEKLLVSLEELAVKEGATTRCAPCWGVLVLSIALRHPTIEACLAELRRNESLRKLIDIESEDKVPRKWNLSRFLDRIGEEPHVMLLHQIFDTMIERLGDAVPDLGRDTAGDATALNARRKKAARAEAEEEQGLPQATGGRKEYTDDEGKVNKVVEWFGFGYALVDIEHEVVILDNDTKAGDGVTLPAILGDAQTNTARSRQDTGLRRNSRHRRRAPTAFEGKHHTVIQNRSLWKEDHERMLPGHDGNSNIVYDEAGTVYCYDRQSQPMVRHKMSYIGHEPQRQTIKYRCPAMHEGWECPMAKICNAGKSYGLTVRVPQEIDVRRFPSLPRATKKFERLYKGRTSVE